jgi:ribosomal protein S18 acetylase RimI-like enzyme
MRITARDANAADLSPIVRLYRGFAGEQAALRPLWHEAHGLPEPMDEAMGTLIAAGAVTVGVIDDVVVGFLVGEEQTLVDGEERVGVIRYLYTEPEARGVGVADVMFSRGVAKLRARGIEAFDAPVSPGHREAKNFYEAHGFSARSITMHSHEPIVGE